MDIHYREHFVSVFGQSVNIYKDDKLVFCVKADNFKWSAKSMMALVDLYINFERM